MKRPMSCIPNS